LKILCPHSEIFKQENNKLREIIKKDLEDWYLLYDTLKSFERPQRDKSLKLIGPIDVDSDGFTISSPLQHHEHQHSGSSLESGSDHEKEKQKQ